MANQMEAAFINLEKAFKKGFFFFIEAQNDPDLALMREQKDRWKAMMQNVLVPDTTDARAWNNLGQVYIQARKYASAEEAMRKAVALDAMSVSWRNNLGFVFLNLGRYSEAEAALKKAI
ncbi:MAG: tetratricopeptide repeat protein [Saprospiraceae bacterium]